MKRKPIKTSDTLAGAPSSTPTSLAATLPDDGRLQAFANYPLDAATLLDANPGLAGLALDGATLADPAMTATQAVHAVPKTPLVSPRAASPRAASPRAVSPKPTSPRPVSRRSPAPPPAAPKRGLLSVDEVFEGYRITAEVGHGGMGRVYRAEHTITGQVVALKMLLPRLLKDAQQRARFINEAKVLARLEHPNLVPLLNFFDTPRGVFIVMPFVEGTTLAKMLSTQGRLPLDTTRELISQIAAGLDAIHRGGIMHRDLKPANILVRSDGRVRITDFGIARSIGAERITRAGMVVGTAEYLSPEQASGESFDDKRSEIYALALLSYEMLTGRVPFRSKSAAEVLVKHVSAAPPPPGVVRPDLPKAVEAVILRGLAKDPADRQPNPLAFAEAFEQAFDTPDDEAQSWRPSIAPTEALKHPLDRVPTKPVRSTGARSDRARSDRARSSASNAAADAPKQRRLSGVLLQVVIGAALGGGLAALAWYLTQR